MYPGLTHPAGWRLCRRHLRPRRPQPSDRLIAIDRDQAALDAAQERLAPWMERVTLVHGNFRDMPELLQGLDLSEVDGILLDLGVSSPQLDDPKRGFSYQHDAPLDMRMDQTQPLTAAVVVNTWSEGQLKDVLRKYGEERYAGSIAGAIVRRRQETPIETTGQLVDVIRSAMPADVVAGAIPLLKPGGRLCVISFHSLEDRIVKQQLAKAAKGCTCPPEFPVCICGKKPQIILKPRKPILPSQEELERNPRARSAKLRVAEKVPN